ncbi:hypothetical protein BMS3Bbin04_00671 [bacterium BMS3Bbin04]|nr:hypothetical protein BMS3Bbin04_00671 [bacterium BMS3Bbin04]
MQDDEQRTRIADMILDSHCRSEWGGSVSGVLLLGGDERIWQVLTVFWMFEDGSLQEFTCCSHSSHFVNLIISELLFGFWDRLVGAIC